MSKGLSNDRAFVEAQYRDADNLNARSALHARFSTNDYGWYRWILDQVALEAGMRVLEVGCGTGALWHGQLDRVPSDCELILSDLSQGMVDQAQASLDDARFEFRALDAQSLPYEDGAFDVVVANHMLYHVPDLDGAIRELTRVLKPGGWVYATTIGENHMRELVQWASRFEPQADPWGGMQPTQFLLEDGPNWLSRYLSTVEVRRYDDALAVKEAQPLVAYLLSTPAREGLWPHLTELVAAIEDEIASSGAIHITKVSGMVMGSKS